MRLPSFYCKFINIKYAFYLFALDWYPYNFKAFSLDITFLNCRFSIYWESHQKINTCCDEGM